MVGVKINETLGITGVRYESYEEEETFYDFPTCSSPTKISRRPTYLIKVGLRDVLRDRDTYFMEVLEGNTSLEYPVSNLRIYTHGSENHQFKNSDLPYYDPKAGEWLFLVQRDSQSDAVMVASFDSVPKEMTRLLFGLPPTPEEVKPTRTMSDRVKRRRSKIHRATEKANARAYARYSKENRVVYHT